MLKLLLVAVLVLYNNVILVVCDSGPMIGPGEFKIYHISYKEGQFNDIIIDLRQSMLDRDTYVYSGEIIADIPLDEGLGLKMDVCKYVDGGCKQYMVVTEESFITFVNKFAEEDIEKCFTFMGIDPPSLPLRQGKYEVKDFLFNVQQLPKNFTYGRYITEMCSLKGTMKNGCITCEFEFMATESGSEEGDSGESDQ